MKKLAVIGYPVMHSLSPKMHNYISEKLGLDYHYRHVEVEPSRLGEAVESFRTEGISGFNVTAPHKVAVMEFLEEISPDAKMFGAVNTVVNENGRFVGYNTDAEGFFKALEYSGVTVAGKDILMLGAGGAAMPVAMYLSKKSPKSLTISNRTREKAQAICEKVAEYSGFCAGCQAELERYDIVINCTSLGMGENIGKSPLTDYSVMDSGSCAVDMIYNPAETEFLKMAKKTGAKPLNGYGMLAFQGMLAYKLFTGRQVPWEMADEIIKEVLSK